jgi:hypothetical protein
MTTHHVRINMISSGRYCVTGACQIASTTSPIQDAALALREAGHPDTDTIVATSGDVAILPATVGSILRPRRRPLQSEIRAMLGTAR